MTINTFKKNKMLTSI